MVLYADASLQAVLRASYEVLGALRDTGSLDSVVDKLASFEQRQAAVRKPEWDELEARFRVSGNGTES